MSNKERWLDEEIAFLKYLCTNCGLSNRDISIILNKKGYVHSYLEVEDKLTELALEPKIEFTDEEKDLIYRMYVIDGIGKPRILKELLKINEYRKLIHLTNYISSNGLKKGSSWSKVELGILKEYYSQGGAALCKQMGLHRTIEGIDTKFREVSTMFSRKYLYNASNLENKGSNYEVSLNKKGGVYTSNGLINMDIYTTRGWSTFDDNYLKKNYLKESDYKIAESLKKHSSQVILRRLQFGLKRDIGDWTEVEDDYIREYYCTKGGKRILRETCLGRTDYEIYKRAELLGIIKRKNKKNRLTEKE